MGNYNHSVLGDDNDRTAKICMDYADFLYAAHADGKEATKWFLKASGLGHCDDRIHDKVKRYKSDDEREQMDECKSENQSEEVHGHGDGDIFDEYFDCDEEIKHKMRMKARQMIAEYDKK